MRALRTVGICGEHADKQVRLDTADRAGCRQPAARDIQLVTSPRAEPRSSPVPGAGSGSPAEDSNACLLVWPGGKPEAFIALVCPDQHDGDQSRPSDSNHLAYAMDPLR